MALVISVVIWFAILSAGSIYGAAVWKKRYEEMLPVTCSAIVLILFVFGIAGNLKAGVAITELLAAVLYIFTVIHLIKSKDIQNFRKNLITPGGVIFCVILAGAYLFNYGKLAADWDEFSHWATVVKAMVTVDGLGTNPQANLLFPEYPPGMALFQYFLQKIYISTGGIKFSEWLLYLAYQVLFFAFVMPFFSNIKQKKVCSALVSGIVVFLFPLIFFNAVYTSLYIDPMLGMLAGTGLATVFLCENRDWLYTLRIACTCMMLILCKDAGALFAVFIVMAYISVRLYDSRQVLRKAWKKAAAESLFVIMALWLPRFVWSIHLKHTVANKTFTVPIDWGKFFNIITAREQGWQRAVWEGYFKKLISQTLPVGNTGISLNYSGLALLMLGAAIVLFLWCEKEQEGQKFKSRLLMAVMSCQYVIYALGLCILYMFKFSSYEGSGYASFDRYMNIVNLAMGIFVILCLLKIFQKSEHAIENGIFILSGIILISPMEYVGNYLRRYYVTSSLKTRAPYEAISAEIERCVPDGSKMWFIAQESTGFEQLVVGFNIQEKFIKREGWGWSIGAPFYEGDVWTVSVTAEEWRKQLLEDYDYVVLYKINDYFVQNFESVFADDTEIAEGTIYEVDRETGLLEKCE